MGSATASPRSITPTRSRRLTPMRARLRGCEEALCPAKSRGGLLLSLSTAHACPASCMFHLHRATVRAAQAHAMVLSMSSQSLTILHRRVGSPLSRSVLMPRSCSTPGHRQAARRCLQEAQLGGAPHGRGPRERLRQRQRRRDARRQRQQQQRLGRLPAHELHLGRVARCRSCRSGR